MPSLMRSASKQLINILITSGPTSVPIDAMRVITNRSTGEIGRLIANRFSKAGARVTLLEGAITTMTPIEKATRHLKFYTYSELQAALYKELERHYDIIVHAAAVSDFVVKKPSKSKLSSYDNLTLELVPTRKLILDIKKRAPLALLVGFKLESKINKKYILPKVAPLFDQAGCSLVVVNKSDAVGYQAYIMKNDRSTTRAVTSKRALVEMLIKDSLLKL